MTISSTEEELDEPLDEDEAAYDELLAIEEETRRRRRRVRTIVAVVLAAFVLTRGIAGYVADHPEVYGSNRADGTGDVQRYDELTWEMRHEDLSPYGEALRMEYPPGAIPIMMVPRYIRLVDYRTEFVVFMVLFDALGLYGLVRIARRTGSWWGPATWFLLVPALGPVTYTRLDMVVAVLLVWTLERALASRWGHVGLLIGIGAAVKLVPVLVLPLLFFVAPRDRRRVLVGAFAGVVALAVLPFVNYLPGMYESVIGYHTKRGVQAESLWGAGLLAARFLWDYPVVIVSSHRAWDAVAPTSAQLKSISNDLSLAVVFGAVVLAARGRVGDLRRASLLAFGTMSLLVGVGRVYSPQYVMWLIGLGAVAISMAPRRAAPAVAVLAVTTVLAHLEFPVWFWDALFYQKGGAIIDLCVRDVLTVAIGVMALWAATRTSKETLVDLS